MIIRFEVPGNPVGKGRPRVCVRGGKTHAYTPQKTVDYAELIRQYFTLKTRGVELENSMRKPKCITILACYNIPGTFSRLRRNAALSGTLRPVVKPDIDNIAKVVLDSLNNLAYKDDAQVVRLILEKQYAIEPCVVVTIEDLDT